MSLDEFGEEQNDGLISRTRKRMRLYKEGPFDNFEAGAISRDALPPQDEVDSPIRRVRQRMAYYKNPPSEAVVKLSLGTRSDDVAEVGEFLHRHPRLKTINDSWSNGVELATQQLASRNLDENGFWKRHPRLQRLSTAVMVSVVASISVLVATVETAASAIGTIAGRFTVTLNDARAEHAANLITDAPEPTRNNLVDIEVVGDSNLSAVGIGQDIYLSSVDSTHTANFWGGCWRAAKDLGTRLAKLNPLYYGSVNHACAGEMTPSIIANQVPLIDPTADVVVWDGGINDLQAIQAINECVQIPAKTIDNCGEKVAAQIEAKIPEVAEKVVALGEAIHAQAPDALLVNFGYPYPLPDAALAYCGLVPQEDLDRIHEEFQRITAMMADASYRAGSYYFDTNAAMSNNRPCSGHSGTVDITPFDYTIRSGDNGGAVAHLNDLGYEIAAQRFATLFEGTRLKNGRVLHFPESDTSKAAAARASELSKSSESVTSTTEVPDYLDIAGGGEPPVHQPSIGTTTPTETTSPEMPAPTTRRRLPDLGFG